MQPRLTDKILFPFVFLYFKTFWHVVARETESGRDVRFYKKPILEQGKFLGVLLCWKVSG